MKGQTAIPQQAYLIAPIVEFDKKKKKKADLLSSLLPLSVLVTLSFKLLNNSPWILFGLLLALVSVTLGFIGMYGIKVYRELGLIEMSREHFSIIKDGEETKIKWSDPESVTLVYLTDYQGEGIAIKHQTEKCWIGFTLNDHTYYYNYLLTFGAMGRSVSNLAKELNSTYPNVKTLNTLGNKNDSLIEKEKAKYKSIITSYNTV